MVLIVCPTCKKKATYDSSNPFRPFCAATCKDRDLIAWAEETFTISRDLTESDLDEVESHLEAKVNQLH